jgi:catechol 2,3-dioxygenase-like lactoylglutathione lyase family enzyme
MSTTSIHAAIATRPQVAHRIDMKLEVLVIPVSDVERAKDFYESLDWRIDADFVLGPGIRLMQFTPPGSPCSIHFGNGLSAAVPGSASGMFLVVSDIEAARADLIARGVEVSEIFHRTRPGGPQVNGVHPERRTYSSFATFRDPDGNTWLLQEVTDRLPGRVDPEETTFASSSDLASALRRAEAAHTEHEKRTGERDVNWPEWYAEYLVNEHSGRSLPT